MCLFSFGWKREIKQHLEKMSKTHYALISDIVDGNNQPVVLTYDNCRFQSKIKKGGKEKSLYIIEKNDKGETTICVNPEFFEVFKDDFEDMMSDD